MNESIPGPKQVPDCSEMIIEGTLERYRFRGELNQENWIVNHWRICCEICTSAAATIVDVVEKHKLCKLRVLNPRNLAVKTAKGAIIGTAEPLGDGMQLLLGVENSQQIHHFDCVRRITLSEGDNVTTISGIII